jgi:hypothetical protein
MQAVATTAIAQGQGRIPTSRGARQHQCEPDRDGKEKVEPDLIARPGRGMVQPELDQPLLRMTVTTENTAKAAPTIAGKRQRPGRE